MRYWLAIAFFKLCALLSLPLNHGLGAVIGRILYLWPNRYRHIAKINLALCYPDLSASMRTKRLKSTLIEAAKTATEAGPIWLWSLERVRGLIRHVSGDDKLRAAMVEGKGVILVIPHLAAWEMIGVYCASRYPMTCLYRPPRISRLGPVIINARQRTGMALAAVDVRGVRTLYQALGRGGLLGILPDQVPLPGSGVYAPFYAIPAYTMVLLPRLIRKTGAAVIMACAYRLPKGQGYELAFEPVDVDAKSSVETIAATVNQAIEEAIELAPTQYQWGYHRFRSRPAGEAEFY